MGVPKYYKEESKKSWYTDQEGKLTESQIQLGAFLRIADATEAKAKRYNDLLRDVKWANEDIERKRQYIKELEYKNRGLKGVITKLKKKVIR